MSSTEETQGISDVSGSGRRHGRLRKILIATAMVILTVVILPTAIVATWLWLDEPRPLDELLSDSPEIDLQAYDGSMAPDEGSPEILILGTPHFAQAEYGFRPEEFDQVNDALAKYDPDLVAVEYLPPEWPSGQGRDYRPGFELDSYVEEWTTTPGEARDIIERTQGGENPANDPCELGRAYFLVRDLANAHYHWEAHNCPELEHDDEIRAWSEQRSGTEHALIGHPVARDSDVEEIVSFDYQGDAAEWFISRKSPEFLLRGRFRDAWNALPEVNQRARELSGHQSEHDDSLNELLYFLNSPQQIGLQYWAYEESMPEISTDAAGERQTENYWLRNERMFEYLDEAVDDQNPNRVLVIVGAGHKYFLDELARDAGYRWIDPREWLPPPE